jgi:hypothetical protein
MGYYVKKAKNQNASSLGMMDLGGLDRQLLSDCGDGLFAFEVTPNDSSLLFSRKFPM